MLEASLNMYDISLEMCVRNIVKARVFRRDSPPMRSRRSTGSGGESSSMLTCGGECSTRRNAFITELETSACTESKRMTNHNTPQLSRMDLSNHCTAFPGLSLLNIRAVLKHLH
jgi:hypothetical protein